MSRKAIASGVLGVVLVVALGYVGYRVYRSQRYRPRPFDAQVWRQGDARLRGGMVNDLVERRNELLIGKTARQVESLLGKPDSAIPGKFTYDVDLGHNKGSFPWSYYFVVSFDGSGVAVDALLLD